MRLAKDSWIVLGMLVVMVASAVLLVYRGQGKTLDEFKTKIIAAQATIETQKKTVAVVPELITRVKEMRSRYKNFDRCLPRRQELGGFLKDISAHLGDDKLSEQVIEPGSPTQEELFHTLPIIMRFQGSYLSGVEFLKSIEDMERLTRIQKLKITRGAKREDEDTAVLDIELQLNIYFTES